MRATHSHGFAQSLETRKINRKGVLCLNSSSVVSCAPCPSRIYSRPTMKFPQTYWISGIVLVLTLVSRNDAQTNSSNQTILYSCDFENDLCGWQSEMGFNSEFVRKTNVAGIKTPPTDCFFLLLNNTLPISTARIVSPEVVITPTTVVLQVNFSYWLQNNQSAELRLIYIPLEGSLNGTYQDLWFTHPEQETSNYWNLTTVYVKKFFEAKRFSIAFQGTAHSREDFIAVERITIEELTNEDVPDVSRLPNAQFVMETDGKDHHCNSATSMTMGLWFTMIFFAAAQFAWHKLL